MPDPARPDDPYQLLGGTPGRWPPLDGDSYVSAAQEWSNYVNGYTHGANQTSMEASRAADTWFNGGAHDAYVFQLQLDRSELQKHATNAAFLQSTLAAAGGKVKAAKTSIIASVEHWNSQIAAAKLREQGGTKLPQGQSSEDLIKQAKQEIQATYDEYKKEMEIVGNQLEQGSNGTPGEGGNTPGKGGDTPGKGGDTGGNGGQVDPKGDEGGLGGSGGDEGSTGGGGDESGGGGEPGSGGGESGSAAAAPQSGGMPSSGGGMPQMPQMPQQMPGQDLASKGMDDLKDMINGKGDQDGVPIDDQTLQDLLDAQNDDSDSDGDDSDSDDSGGASDTASEEPAAPVQHNATIGQDNGPSPASPVHTTPGHSMPGGSAPVTQLSGAHMGGVNSFTAAPITELSGAHGGSSTGFSGAPAGGAGAGPAAGGMGAGGMSGGAPGGISAGRPQGSSAGGSRPTVSESRTGAATPAAGAPSREVPATPETYIDDMLPAQARGHQVVAALTDQFRRVRWPSTPIAVGVFSSRTVFATGDAISIWPFGIRIPEGTVPLDLVAGAGSPSFVGWFGVNRPAEKIIKIASAIPGLGELEAVVVNAAAGSTVGDTHGGLVTVQTQEQLDEAITANTAAAVSVSRAAMATVPEDTVTMALSNLEGAVPDSAKMGSATNAEGELRKRVAGLWALRRGGNSDDSGYLTALVGYLLAEAHVAVETGNVADAGYSVSEILSLTERLVRG